MAQTTRFVLTTTITNGTSASAALQVDGFPIISILMPTAWTAAGLAFSGSYDGTNYYAIKDRFNAEITCTVAASGVVQIDPVLLLGIPYIKLISGTNAAPVNQLADRAFSVAVKYV